MQFQYHSTHAIYIIDEEKFEGVVCNNIVCLICCLQMFLFKKFMILDGSCIAKESVPLPDGLKYFLIIILSIMFLVCTLGNSLTLVALTYVRSYYGR